MIRLNTRTLVGVLGSAVMTVCSFGVLDASLSHSDAQRNLAHAQAAHSATIDEWQLAEKDTVVVRAPRA